MPFRITNTKSLELGSSVSKTLLLQSLCYLFVLLLVCPATSAKDSKTNVVLILVDNHGYHHLGCKGNPYLKTPNIDKLARQSVDFCNFHAENFCSPSRAALLTGRQPMRYGVHNTVGGVSLLSPNEITLSERLKKSGYRTGIFGKWHLGMSYPFHPSLRGFDEVFVHGGGGIGQLEDFKGNRHMNARFQYKGKWIKTSGFSTDVLFDRAMEFIESSKEQPFFCYIPTPAVHFPVQPEPKALDRIKKRGVTSEQDNLSLLSMIENLDDNLGRLVKRLDKLKLRDNTMIIFMGDQGVGNRGSIKPVWPGKDRQKDLGNASEGKHRVYCMIQKSGLTVASQNHALACIRDLCPTILEICGVETTDKFDGRSLVPLLKGQGEWKDDRIVVMQCPRARTREKWKHAAVKMKHWRLVNGGRLYNVKTDSLMKKNVAAAHPKIAERLNLEYEKFWKSLPPEKDIVQRHVLGASQAPKTLLCAMDWREGGSPWNFGALKDGFRGQGKWYVTVSRDGMYRITLCRAMKETPMPVGAISAKVQFGNLSATKTVSENDTEIVIEIRLKKGDYTFHSILQDSKKSSKTWGANFAYVEFVGPNKN